MKLQHLAILTGAAILSLGILSGCANEQSKTTNSEANSTTASNNQTDTKSSTIYTDNGLAIKGFDPVAYFQEEQPVKGKSDFTYEWMNAKWQFSSAENRDLFASNPEKYAPQYGGFCAYAVSQGSTAPTDPNAWKIVEDKLYLNLNKQIQATWEKDIPGYIAKADSNWPGVLN